MSATLYYDQPKYKDNLLMTDLIALLIAPAVLYIIAGIGFYKMRKIVTGDAVFLDFFLWPLGLITMAFIL